MKMLNNITMKDPDLFITVEGCKEKQPITTEDLIRKCKIKRKILDRAWNETEANRRTNLSEPIKNNHTNHIVQIKSNPNLFQGKDDSTYKRRGGSTAPKKEHLMVPGQVEAKRVSLMLDEKIKSKVNENNCDELGIDFDSISEDSNSYVMVEYGLNPYERRKLTRRKSCLCQHQDIIFHETEDSEITDTFPEDFLARLDHYHLDREVPWSSR